MPKVAQHSHQGVVSIQWTNDTGAKVEKGEFVVTGHCRGFLAHDVDDGKSGALIISCNLVRMPVDRNASRVKGSAGATVEWHNGQGSIRLAAKAQLPAEANVVGYLHDDVKASDTVWPIVLRGYA